MFLFLFFWIGYLDHPLIYYYYQCTLLILTSQICIFIFVDDWFLPTKLRGILYFSDCDKEEYFEDIFKELDMKLKSFYWESISGYQPFDLPSSVGFESFPPSLLIRRWDLNYTNMYVYIPR